MLQDKVIARGRVHLILVDAQGNIKHEDEIDNLVVTAGKAFIASRMTGASAGVMSHMAIGTGSTAPAAGNTSLGSEVGRVALTSSTPSGASIPYIASFGAGVGTGSIAEAGLFNASSSGTMLCRTVFGVITKGANDVLGITWTVTIT